MSAQSSVVLCFLMIGLSIGEPLPPSNLQCDRNMVGLSSTQLKTLHSRHHFATDSRYPLFSWTIDHTDKGATCTGFRLILTTDITFNDVIWDSGLIKENKQELKYNGPPLKGGQVYLWRVTWWDGNGVGATSKEIGHFLAVTLTPQDWAPVKWISPPNGMDTAPTFTKDVTLSSTSSGSVGTATLYVSGLGFFRAWINDVDVLSRADPPISLTPGWTNYEIRVPYMTFDVSSLITTTQLSIKISLGEGWRNTSQFPPHDKPFPSTDSSPYVLRVMMNIIFNDTSSTKLSIISDKTWSVQSSHIQANSIYNGEVYDATITPKLIGNAVETAGPSGVMYLPTMSYIAETGIIDHVKEITLDPSSIDDHFKQVVDFGANTAGFVKIKVDEIKSDQVLQLVHAEIPMHPPYGKKDGSLYFDNLRSATQLDYYTSNGTETYYQPTFTYHGFRYALVINFPRKLTPDDLYKIRINSNLKSNSKFNVSTELLNEIQANVVRGHLSNLMSVPTDCDQRDERLGWMGDAGLSADAMVLNFHMESFFPHHALLMKDEQINGNLPDVVPFYHGGGRPSDPSWGAAYPQTVWVLWKYYGDTDTAKTYYTSLLEYIDFIENEITKGIGQLNGRYGDWVPPPPNKKIDNTFPSAFSFMQNIQQVSEIAQALGDTANATRLKDMFTKHATEFNTAFYSSTTNQYLDDLQISYTLPLALGIVPSNDKDKVVTNFIHKITGPDKSHVTAGIVGVKPLLPVLTDLKQHDLAMTIVTQIDYPSWGYMIHNTDEPATAIWELWNANSAGPGMNSRNHHMFSSVSSWLQTDMIGLKQTPNSYGYKSLDLYPAQSLDLSSASIILEHPKLIKYSWSRQGGIQCGKGVENNNGLFISCGGEGFIEKVLFASYGNPVGSCGYHRHGNCHSLDSISNVEHHCLNKTHCTVPTHNDYWKHDCAGSSDIIKWLSVAVQCTNKLPSLKMSVSVPMGSLAKLHLPSYGMSHMTVWDKGNLFYSTKQPRSTSHVVDSSGLDTVQWNKEGNTLELDIVSGHYEFTVKGEQAEETHENIISTDNCTLSCSNVDRIITSIDWVSYGNALQVGAVGSCHSGASRYIVETACLGRTKCLLVLSESFGSVPCTANEWKLAVKYSCNKRVI